jgi:hypothetical protein
MQGGTMRAARGLIQRYAYAACFCIFFGCFATGLGYSAYLTTVRPLASNPAEGEIVPLKVVGRPIYVTEGESWVIHVVAGMGMAAFAVAAAIRFHK